MSFIAWIFLKLLTPKNVVYWMVESSCFRTPFWSQRVNESKTRRKSARRCFYANFPLISDKSRMKRILLVISELLGLHFNRLAGNNMYSHLNRETFPQLNPTELRQKPKTFSAIFIQFFKSTWNFEQFRENDELHSLNIIEVIANEDGGFLKARKLLLQNTLLKSLS